MALKLWCTNLFSKVIIFVFKFYGKKKFGLLVADLPNFAKIRELTLKRVGWFFFYQKVEVLLPAVTLPNGHAAVVFLPHILKTIFTSPIEHFAPISHA